MKETGRCSNFLLSVEETVCIALFPAPCGIQGQCTKLYHPVGSEEGTWGFGGNSAPDERKLVDVSTVGIRFSLHFKNCLALAWDPPEPIPGRLGGGVLELWHHQDLSQKLLPQADDRQTDDRGSETPAGFFFLLSTLVQCRVVRLGVLKDTTERWVCGAPTFFCRACGLGVQPCGLCCYFSNAVHTH